MYRLCTNIKSQLPDSLTFLLKYNIYKMYIITKNTPTPTALNFRFHPQDQHIVNCSYLAYLCHQKKGQVKLTLLEFEFLEDLAGCTLFASNSLLAAVVPYPVTGTFNYIAY